MRAIEGSAHTTSSTIFCSHCGARNALPAAFCFACGQPLTGSSSLTGLLVAGPFLKQRYHLVCQVGQGGFGAVYAAGDTQLGDRLVAVKEMSQRGLTAQELQEATDAFQREAHLLAKLRHPHLPAIYDHFRETGRWYLVMEYIEGEPLESALAKAPGGCLPVQEALELGLQLCTVLEYMHAQQPPIIFRDLKPANIMVTPQAEVSLIDFGIARHFTPGQARDTTAFGSAGYAAPEQYGKAQTTTRSDIYSLGATLHHVLSGSDPAEHPFVFAPLQLEGPTGLERLIEQMLEADQRRRPESMAAIKQQFQQLLASWTASGPMVGSPSRSQPVGAGPAQGTPTSSHPHPASPAPVAVSPAPADAEAKRRSPLQPAISQEVVEGERRGHPKERRSGGLQLQEARGRAERTLPSGKEAQVLQTSEREHSRARLRLRAVLLVLMLLAGGATGLIYHLEHPVSITEYPVPTAGSDPTGIAVGPDGNLWFTESAGANQIGRLTPGGRFTEYPVPGVDSGPTDIVVGRDGALWFTEQSVGEIGRLTPGGSFAEFTAGSEPLGIAVGPDGNLWFTEGSGNQIGRLTPGGHITEFPTPTAASQPWGIVVGPDSNLWFTEPGTNQIGRLTPPG